MSHNHTRVAVQLAALWTELTVAPDAEIVRIQADDLGEAQRLRARLRSDAVERGESADGTAVFLDLEIYISADARTARREFAGLAAPDSPSTIRYVGTPSGLASLISDIAAAEVADGVTLQVHGDADRQSTLLSSGVLPILGGRGTRFDIDTVDAVLDTGRVVPTLAS